MDRKRRKDLWGSQNNDMMLKDYLDDFIIDLTDIAKSKKKKYVMRNLKDLIGEKEILGE